MRISLLISIASCLFSCSTKQSADLIYINAKIWTGDSANQRATSLAIKDSTIIYVGLDYHSYQSPATKLIDLQGEMMVPGFIDNHTHFLSGGFQLSSVDLRTARSANEFIAILKKYSAEQPTGRWIAGGDWDHEAWGGMLPTRQWVDSVTGNHPLFINRYDGHMVLVNSIVLKLAGIDSHTPNPAGGEIVKDIHTGEPTGVLKDGAMDLVTAIMPPPTTDELDEMLAAGVRHAFEHGVTQITDMSSFGGWTDLDTYRRAFSANRLGLRIYSFVPIATWQRLDSFVHKNGRGNALLHWGGLKGFVDGSLGSTTALFYRPYLDAPGKNGIRVTDSVLLREWIRRADSAGLNIAVHAIGDYANDWILNTFQDAEDANGIKDRRFRIEHAQHLTQQAIPRFAKLGVIASVQPYHAIDDGKWAAKRLDTARLLGTYAFKSLIDANARVTFGSDWTVAPLDPIAGIYAAVTRRTLDNKNPDGWFPDQKISVEQALQSYTVNNAFANFTEKRTGMLKAGMLADLTVLSDDLFEVKPEKIRDVKVLRTILNGKEVYSASTSTNKKQ